MWKSNSPSHKVAGQQVSLGLVPYWFYSFSFASLYKQGYIYIYICLCVSTYLHSYIFIFIPLSSVMAVFHLYHLKWCRTSNYQILVYVQHYVGNSTHLISSSHPNRPIRDIWLYFLVRDEEIEAQSSSAVHSSGILLFFNLCWSVVDLQCYVTFRCTAQQFSIFADYISLLVIKR